MKKIITLLSLSFLYAASLFAENVISLGGYAPLASLSVGGSGVNAFGGGAVLNFTHISENNLTWEIYGGLSKIATKDIWTPENDYSSGTGYTLGGGIGIALINEEDMTLTVTANIGMDSQKVSFDTSLYELGRNTGTFETSLKSVLYYIGPKAAFNYHLTDKLSLFAELGLFYAQGKSEYKQTYTVSDEILAEQEKEKTQRKKDHLPPAENQKEGSVLDDELNAYGILAQPKIGISYRF